MTVTLRPTATLTGRLVDGEGKPASGGVRVELAREAGALLRAYSRRVGRARLRRAIPL